MKLFYLLLVSFVLIASSSLTLGNAKKLYDSQDDKRILSHEVEEEVEYEYIPFLKENATLLELSAQAVLAVDMASGKTLYEKQATAPMLPASTTKIITALVAMDKYPLDWILTVGEVGIEGQKMDLVPGERITVRNLLYGLLIESGNDAAEVLAENFPGGRDEFINAMNLKAKELGLANTSFKNPSGLDGVGHKTTAKDLIKASTLAMQRPFFKKAVAIKEIDVASVDEQTSHHLVNINELVGEVEGVSGVKTGWTEEARENLVTYLERESGNGEQKKIMIALLASQDRFGETKELINWILENYEWRYVVKSEQDGIYSAK